MKTNKQSGFTLVELAIVLVIIGLIVGGVLVGQDMIKAAELRAAVGQIEKYDTAVNVFRNKYNGLPGDLLNPGNFGFQPPSVTSKLGNGVLDAAVQQLDEEPGLFFADLSVANLIQESLARTTAQVTSGGLTTAMSDYAPISKLGKGIFVYAQSNGGVNYYMMDNPTLVATGAVTNAHSAMSPIVAVGIDTKLDDGVPTTGKVMAVDNIGGTQTATYAAGFTNGKCVNSTPTPNAYVTNTQQNADAPACTLRIKASF